MPTVPQVAGCTTCNYASAPVRQLLQAASAGCIMTTSVLHYRFRGTVSASAQADFTVKVEVSGLQPATRYFYFFQSGNHQITMHSQKRCALLTAGI